MPIAVKAASIERAGVIPALASELVQHASLFWRRIPAGWEMRGGSLRTSYYSHTMVNTSQVKSSQVIYRLATRAVRNLDPRAATAKIAARVKRTSPPRQLLSLLDVRY